ncbi:MAG TPA: hypothetical protein VMT46_07635 [Anaerolineaceae bacterium]|nr:hypothetical protein [Anaerolineaceae bacterium]
MGINLIFIKLGLMTFWATWLTVEFLTNLFDDMKVVGVLPTGWKFASKNYEAISNVTSIYNTPRWVNGFLFLGVIVWQGLAGLLFWRATIGFLRMGPASYGDLYLAFAVSLGLWGAIMIADEIFQNHDQLRSHLAIFIAQIVTLLAIHLLPL